MHETNTTFALARYYTRILLCRLRAPAKPAGKCWMIIFTLRCSTLCLVLFFFLKCDDWLGFLEFLLIEFLGGLRHKFTLEILHSEFHPAELQYVKLFDLVVLPLLKLISYIFAMVVFQRSDDEPEAVDAVFFKFVAILCMIHIESGAYSNEWLNFLTYLVGLLLSARCV